MEYVKWFVDSTFYLLSMPINIFGFTWRFFDADIYIMFAAIAIFVIRKLLGLHFDNDD